MADVTLNRVDKAMTTTVSSSQLATAGPSQAKPLSSRIQSSKALFKQDPVKQSPFQALLRILESSSPRCRSVAATKNSIRSKITVCNHTGHCTRRTFPSMETEISETSRQQPSNSPNTRKTLGSKQLHAQSFMHHRRSSTGCYYLVVRGHSCKVSFLK